MQVGDLEVEVRRERPGWRLQVQGKPFGVETPVTEEELRSLAAYLLRAAEAAKEA